MGSLSLSLLLQSTTIIRGGFVCLLAHGVQRRERSLCFGQLVCRSGLSERRARNAHRGSQGREMPQRRPLRAPGMRRLISTIKAPPQCTCKDNIGRTATDGTKVEPALYRFTFSNTSASHLQNSIFPSSAAIFTTIPPSGQKAMPPVEKPCSTSLSRIGMVRAKTVFAQIDHQFGHALLAVPPQVRRAEAGCRPLPATALQHAAFAPAVCRVTSSLFVVMYTTPRFLSLLACATDKEAKHARQRREADRMPTFAVVTAILRRKICCKCKPW